MRVINTSAIASHAKSNSINSNLLYARQTDDAKTESNVRDK